MNQPEILFREEQKFNQLWLWLIVLGTTGMMWYGFIQQIIFDQPFGTNPTSNWLMWFLWLLIGIGLPLLVYNLKLIVEVSPDHISIRFVPFVSRTILYKEIKRFQARSYNPVREYGGWGIKGWSRKRMAYNVSGNQGVELEFYTGQSLMIGSQKYEELAQAIASQMSQG